MYTSTVISSAVCQMS